MASKSRERTQTKAAKATGRKPTPQLDREADQILEKAQMYLLFEAKRPMFWNVAGVREEKGVGGSRRWIIAVHLRAPSGHEGYLGDLLYDGQRFTELTDVALMRERGRQIAADPGSPSPRHEKRRVGQPPQAAQPTGPIEGGALLRDAEPPYRY
jgi:hypothetical protein